MINSRVIAIFLMMLFVSTHYLYAQTLKVGAKVPEFKLTDQDGNEFDLDSVIGKRNIVIYFYPKDFTPGCTKEACSFRDQFDDFKQSDALIIGISAQSIKSHKEFAEKYRLPFTLLSDKDNEVRKLFGVRTNPIPGRVTFVVNKMGHIVYTFDSLTQPEKHVEEAMAILKKLG